MKNYIKFVPSVFLIFFLSACNIPGRPHQLNISASDMVLTAAVQTVEAQIALNPAQMNEATAQPTLIPPTTDSSAGVATTALPTKVSENNGCDIALFVDDVTVRDGTPFSPGEVFTKTWRFQNIGSCSWTSGYEIVFFEGDLMSGSASKQLTTVSISTGNRMDISVELVAPNSIGTYRGYWKLRNANGENFTFTNDLAFWVDIEVVAPTATPGPKIETFTLTMIDEGAVQSDGFTFPAPNVGDTNEDLGLQAFMLFDISPIPLGATINEVVVSFTNFDVLGDPFINLGCLRGYRGNYFPLDSGDYMSSTGSSMEWCNFDQLDAAAVNDNVKTDIQNSLGNHLLEYRLQFNEIETDFDGKNDMVRFGTVSLRIVYQIGP